MLTKERSQYEQDIIQQNIDMNRLDNFLYNFKNTEDVFRVTIYVPGWLMYADQDINYNNIDKFRTTYTYKKLMKSQDKVYWLPPEQVKKESDESKTVPVISMLRKIRNRDEIGDIIGIANVSIEEQKIEEIITKANITKTGVVYIQNSEGAIICTSNPDIPLKNQLEDRISQELAQNPMSWSKITIGTGDFTVNSKAIANTDWTLITAIPYREILSESIKIRNLLIFLMVVIGVVSYIVSFIISTSTTRRITLLTRNMEKVQEGDLEVSMSSHSQDEIGKLINSFNYMVKRINVMAEEQRKFGKDIKNSKGRDFISIEDEVKHVKTYVEIQNLRFNNCIGFEVIISPNSILPKEKEIF